MSALDSDDEEMDWEEIVPPQKLEASNPETSSSSDPFQITIRAPNQKQSESDARKERSRAEALQRFVRLQAHRLHTIAHLCNGSIRNKWINDPLLHVCLMPHVHSYVLTEVRPAGPTYVPYSVALTDVPLNDYKAQPT
jgi:hypothetical protein